MPDINEVKKYWDKNPLFSLEVKDPGMPEFFEELNKIEKEDVEWLAMRFFAVTATVSLLSTGLIHLMINVFGVPVGFNPYMWLNIAIGITIPVSFLGNFFGYKIFVFKDKKA